MVTYLLGVGFLVALGCWMVAASNLRRMRGELHARLDYAQKLILEEGVRRVKAEEMFAKALELLEGQIAREDAAEG